MSNDWLVNVVKSGNNMLYIGTTGGLHGHDYKGHLECVVSSWLEARRVLVILIP